MLYAQGTYMLGACQLPQERHHVPGGTRAVVNRTRRLLLAGVVGEGDLDVE